MSDALPPDGARRETIAAVATPAGRGGVAIVRVSGDDALGVVRAVFRPRRGGESFVSHQAVVGLVVWPDAPGPLAPGTPLDEGLALPLLAPRSYSGDDTVELQVHGGPRTAELVLAACVAAGARPAGPGEFTRRAFLNGRLSLDQAEAVADLIHADDELAARGALAQLRGGLHREVVALETPLLALLARLEGSLEFAEEENGEPVPRDELLGSVHAALVATDRLLALAPAARRVRDGVQVVLTGPPNAGKSSLFNALLGRERALVDPEPGTTRDVVSDTLHHAGLAFVLHDTAGLRDEAGRIEALGIDRALVAARGADIVLRLRDLSAPAPGEIAQPAEAGREAVVLDVGTKLDMAPAETAGHWPDLRTSALSGVGIVELKEALASAVDAAGLREAASAGVLLNQRHQSRLMQFRDDLNTLVTALKVEEVGDEVAATLLFAALAGLGEISGRVFTERLLGEIFSQFCVGK